MTRSLPITLILLLAAVPAASQQLSTARPDSARVVPLDAPVFPRRAAEHVVARQEDQARGFFSLTGMAHAIGGAIVGGWAGYVGAQVVRSDWDKKNNGSFAGQRWTWVAGGVAVGLLGSRLVGRTSTPTVGPRLQPPRNRLIITAQEIEWANANNAYELIADLRSEWLVQRGANRWSESDRGTAYGLRRFVVDITPGENLIIVYLDNAEFGGVEDLKEIPTSTLRKAEFIDGRRATYLYGAGHAHGVIRLSTAATMP